VNKSDLKEGDLVFFKIGWNRLISHVGLYLGNHKFVHAAIWGGVIISDLREPYYARWYVAASRNIPYLRKMKSYGKEIKKIAIQVFETQE
jgi:lipoprotein Spr